MPRADSGNFKVWFLSLSFEKKNTHRSVTHHHFVCAVPCCACDSCCVWLVEKNTACTPLALARSLPPPHPPQMSVLTTVPDVVSAATFYTDLSRVLGRVLVFFFHFAWRVKVRLPALLTVAFLAFDIRVRVEIEVQVWF